MRLFSTVLRLFCDWFATDVGLFYTQATPSGSADLAKAKKLLLHSNPPTKGKTVEVYTALKDLREAQTAEEDALGKLEQVEQVLSDAGARVARRKELAHAKAIPEQCENYEFFIKNE